MENKNYQRCKDFLSENFDTPLEMLNSEYVSNNYPDYTAEAASSIVLNHRAVEELVENINRPGVDREDEALKFLHQQLVLSLNRLLAGYSNIREHDLLEKVLAKLVELSIEGGVKCPELSCDIENLRGSHKDDLIEDIVNYAACIGGKMLLDNQGDLTKNVDEMFNAAGVETFSSDISAEYIANFLTDDTIRQFPGEIGMMLALSESFGRIPPFSASVCRGGTTSYGSGDSAPA